MAEDPRAGRIEDREDFEINGPGGLGMKFRGSNQLLLVMLLCFVAFAGLCFYIQQNELIATSRDLAAIKRDVSTQDNLRALSAAVAQQGRTQEAIIYVLTLNEAERKALRLNKPDAIREMQR